MDIRMEPTTGIEAAETILKDFPDAKILFRRPSKTTSTSQRRSHLAVEDIY